MDDCPDNFMPPPHLLICPAFTCTINCQSFFRNQKYCRLLVKTSIFIHQKHYVNEMMETYAGPQMDADIIIMSHIGYYFPDSFAKQMVRALSWLNKEGGRILLVHAQDTVNKLIGKCES